MARELPKNVIAVIDERLSRLKRDINDLLGGVGPIPEAECGCFRDKGCCSDKGCCGDKGCCKDSKSHPPDWEPDWDELVELSDKVGLPVGELVDRIRKLDPELLGIKG